VELSEVSTGVARELAKGSSSSWASSQITVMAGDDTRRPVSGQVARGSEVGWRRRSGSKGRRIYAGEEGCHRSTEISGGGGAGARCPRRRNGLM
jgi:hypothetical protein